MRMQGIPQVRGGAVEDEVVLTGLSGRLPESDSIQEFADKLFAGVDLVTTDDRRWTPGLHGLPERQGKLKDLASFDATFFGVHGKQAHLMDPQQRLLLEVTYEAIVDAGLSPAELRGSRTGVYVGVSNSETEEIWEMDPDKINGYSVLGCGRAMFPNRISHMFDLKGPSYAIETGCSSSMFAMAQAVEAMRAGHCDAAVVAGTQLCLKPNYALNFHRLSMLSPEGRCASFDATGRGFVRSEAVVTVVLQRRGAARRVYATVRGAGMNTDGAQKQGVGFPNGDMQRRLATELFNEAGLRPQDVVYLEAHGPGTKAGDSQEVNALAELFCKDRPKERPLLLGSVKSNMGHAEPASALCSITKVLVAMQAGEIPANLHYSTPNPDIPALSDGRIQVVAKNTKFDGGLVAVNSFAFAGANAHLILEAERAAPRPTSSPYAFPRVVAASGRTDEAVRALLAHAANHAHDAELHALIDAVHAQNIPGHARRGYRVLDGANQPTEDVVECDDGEPRPIWFVFAGMGSQWAGMARELLTVPAFAASIARSAAALKPHGLDLVRILTEADEAAFDDVVNSFVSIAAVQVALVDVLSEVGIKPDGIVGHSFGELGCAYADETLTGEQTVMCAYWQGRSIVDARLAPGAMAAVGLSWEKCLERLPADVFPACHNAADSVTISGPVPAIEKVVADLSAEGIFARRVNSSGVAFHSKYIASAVPLLRASLEKVIPAPRPRSARWVSSSVPKEQWDSALAKFSDASYHVNNLLSPGWFYGALSAVPARALLVEVAPHALLQAVLGRTLPQAALVPLVRKDAPRKDVHLLAALGKIFAHGGQPQLGRLYPAVRFPVSLGTPTLASHVKWDHSTQWSVARFANRSGESVVEIDLSQPESAYIAGHNIDGRIMFPAMGYLAMMWRTMAKLHGKKAEETAVVLEDVQFKRATLVPNDAPVRFLISVLDGSGAFEICNRGAVVVSGVVKLAEDSDRVRIELPPAELHKADCAHPPLVSEDVYKELRLRGYNYAGIFRGIRQSDPRGTSGQLAWEDNWVSFMDTMLQYFMMGVDTRELYLPTRLQRTIIDPKAHAAALAALPAEEGKEATLPIRVVRDVDVVSAGGVEFRGLKISLTPRHANPHPAPKLEKYVFVPYDTSSVTTEDTSRAKHEALLASVQLALEVAGVLRMRVVEAAMDCAAEALLLPGTLALLAAEPMVRVEASLAAGYKHELYQAPLKDLEVKINNKDPRTGGTERDCHFCHLVLCADVLSRHGDAALSALGGWLAEGGVLLLEEPLQLLDQPAARAALQRAGLVLASRQVATNCEYILLKKKPELLSAESVVIELKDNFNYQWVDKLREALARAYKPEMRVYAVARSYDSGVLGLATCLRGEAGGRALRVFHAPGLTAPFSTTTGPFAAQAQLDLPFNVLRAGVWGCYRHLPLQDAASQARLQVEHAYVNTLTRGDLASLRWIESPLRYAIEAPSRPNSELCRVYYAPLNFRDIMLATGKLPPDALPSDLAGQECILGLEFSGRGAYNQRVMGMVAARGLATSVVADKGFLWPVPDKWTLQEAATVPVAYATAYYALSVRGRMQRGESVLIHAETGGVGQAAIGIALHAGCTVYTTVGTAEKCAFLQKLFPALDPDNIGNSRDCSFEQLVRRRTRGRGVDLVLNSLAADKLLASLRCLAPGGRFLDIGKVDLYNNSPLGILKNTTYHGIMLDALFDANGNDADKIAVSRYVSEGIANGAIKPLCCTVFAEHQLEQAFRFMATGKHIGKVLLRVREEESPFSKTGRARLVSALPRTCLHPARVCVLVGGLGGIGLELAQWLVQRGARALVLVSRTGVRTGYQAWCVRRWTEQGVRVIVSKQDCTTLEGACKLLTEAKQLGPISAVFNLAAVLPHGLHGAFLEDLTTEDFKTVAKPKINTTLALDVATRELAPDLEYFVVFSSVACGRGSPGLSNYGLANSAMERIVERRQRDGLPGLAVQWGVIGEVGLIVDLTGRDDLEVRGMVTQRIASCMEALGTLMALPHAVTGSMVVADKRRAASQADKGDLEYREDLERKVANILGIKNPHKVSASASLATLGMDSLMAAEIKQMLEHVHDLALSVQEIRALTFARLRVLLTATN